MMKDKNDKNSNIAITIIIIKQIKKQNWCTSRAGPEAGGARGGRVVCETSISAKELPPKTFLINIAGASGPTNNKQ